MGPVKWLHLVVMGAGAGLCLLRAVMRRDERGARLLLGLGVSVWVLVELYFTVALWSDMSPPVLAAVGGRAPAVATNLSYPIADLLLLGLICALLAVGGRRADRRLGVLALGTVVALAVLIAGTLTDVSPPAVGLASGALVSVLVRLTLTFRAHEGMLTRSQTEALTDPLAGLGNRRALAGALTRRLHVSPRSPILLALFDLDGFKRYNDRFGHAAGDALLRRLADALSAVIATAGGAYRMGGDEFCVLVPAGDAGQALLRAAAAGLAERGDGFVISASVGSVALPEETDDAEEALRLADQRMYGHKNAGRRSGAAYEVKQALLSELADHVDDVADLAERTARALACPPGLVEAVRIGAELHDVDERWDGGGYPDGLTGEEIPLGARIIAVCDSYHAMTSDRSYRLAMSRDVALAELRAGATTQFDPEVVRAFLALGALVPAEPGAIAVPRD